MELEQKQEISMLKRKIMELEMVYSKKAIEMEREIDSLKLEQQSNTNTITVSFD
jgi:acetyl-CoA carboxylase alpha subunit